MIDETATAEAPPTPPTTESTTTPPPAEPFSDPKPTEPVNELELPPAASNEPTVADVGLTVPPDAPAATPAPVAVDEEKPKIPPGVSEVGYVPSTDVAPVEAPAVVAARHGARIKDLVGEIGKSFPQGHPSVGVVATLFTGTLETVTERQELYAHLAALDNAIPAVDRWKVKEVYAILREFDLQPA